MMTALRQSQLMLADHERFGWVDADPDPEAMERRRQRTRRRAITNTLMETRNYWVVIRYLSEGVLSGAIMPYFWSLDEAARHYRAKRKISERLDIDDVTARYVVARYFALSRWHWLEAA